MILRATNGESAAKPAGSWESKRGPGRNNGGRMGEGRLMGSSEEASREGAACQLVPASLVSASPRPQLASSLGHDGESARGRAPPVALAQDVSDDDADAGAEHRPADNEHCEGSHVAHGIPPELWRRINRASQAAHLAAPVPAAPLDIAADELDFSRSNAPGPAGGGVIPAGVAAGWRGAKGQHVFPRVPGRVPPAAPLALPAALPATG